MGGGFPLYKLYNIMLCILKGMVFEPFCSEVGYRFNCFEDSHRARFCSLCLDQGLELGIFFYHLSFRKSVSALQ